MFGEVQTTRCARVEAMNDLQAMLAFLGFVFLVFAISVVAMMRGGDA